MYFERFETKRNNLTTMGNFILSSFTPIYRIIQIVVIILVPLHLEGVFGVDVKSVMEGDSVTLYTHLTEIQKADLILWTFGSESTRIAQINRLVNKISYYDVLDGRFRDRLKLDKQTGSLTITNITTQHTGLYGFLQIIGEKQATPKKFSVIVSARLPVPVISSNSSQCSSSSSSSSSSSYCSLVCSVVNTPMNTRALKSSGNSLLSSSSVSDLSSSLSLPLEVEYPDKNSYSCVLNNPISNQTQHLDITQFCHTCPAPDSSACYIELVCFSALAVVAVFFGIFYCCHHRRSKQAANQGPPDGEEHIRLTNGVVNGNTGDTDRPNSAGAETPDQEKHSQNSDFIVKDEIELMKTMRGQSVTLHTDLTEIEENELIWWKFADSSVNKEAEFSVIAKWDKTNNEEYLCNEERFKDRLHLDHNTGSLTITNITPKHYGHYKLHTSEGRKISKTFSVALYDPKKRPEIQRIGLDNRRVHSF